LNPEGVREPAQQFVPAIVPPGDGCDKDLDWWFTDEGLHPKPGPEMPLTKPACRSVLAEP
jgi:penicillin-insensitive murein endopeptidase